jgi:hypothetical protein
MEIKEMEGEMTTTNKLTIDNGELTIVAPEPVICGALQVFCFGSGIAIRDTAKSISGLNATFCNNLLNKIGKGDGELGFPPAAAFVKEQVSTKEYIFLDADPAPRAIDGLINNPGANAPEKCALVSHPFKRKLFLKFSNALFKLGTFCFCLSLGFAYKSKRVSEEFDILFEDFLDGLAAGGGADGLVDSVRRLKGGKNE